MALDTYANLKTEIALWLDRDDLTAYIDTFIDLAEENLAQDLRVREMETRSDLTINARFIDLPTGFLEAVSLYIDATPIHRVAFVSAEQLNDFYESAAGKPNYFSIIGTEMGFERTPDAAYTGKLVYFKRPTALSDVNITNDILTNFPGVYLWGSLAAAEPFLGNDGRLATWAALYQAHVKKANNSARRGRFSGPAIQMRPDVYPV